MDNRYRDCEVFQVSHAGAGRLRRLAKITTQTIARRSTDGSCRDCHQIRNRSNPAGVAKWLGVATRTLCLWAECKEIPGLKVGRQWRFREGELRKCLESP